MILIWLPDAVVAGGVSVSQAGSFFASVAGCARHITRPVPTLRIVVEEPR